MQRAGDVELDDVRALATPFDEIFGAARIAGPQRRDIVRRAELSIGARLHHELHLRRRAPRRLRHAQRVVVRSGNRIVAGGQQDLAAQIADDETRSRRRDVADHQHHAEELIQIPDVPGDDDNARNGWHDELIAPEVRHLEHEADDLQVGNLGLQPQRVWNDRFQFRQGRSDVESGETRLIQRDVLCRLQRGQHDRKRDLDGRVLHREGRREVVRLEAGLVEDDALVANFLRRQRASGDLRDEQLVDHLDRHALGRAAHQDLAATFEADLFQGVDTGDAEWRDVDRAVR